MISSHVLDTALGLPATGIPVRLERLEPGGDVGVIGQGVTDADGRVNDFLRGGELAAGTYRLCFDTEPYFFATGRPCFFPRVDVVFRVEQAGTRFHIPLLLSPYGYSTYRGS
jgi:5-hydroxyisourate hydrolase